MQYGAMNFPVRAVQTEIERIAAMGFDFLELAMDPPQAHYSQVLEQKNEIIGRLQRHHMGLVCHLPTFVYTADLTESIRRASLTEMMGSLETAHVLAAEKVVLHPGAIGGLGAFVLETSRGFALESLAAISEKANALGMSLCLENMFPRYLSFVEPEDFQTIFESFPQMKLTLDVGHAHIGDVGRDRIVRFIRLFHHRLGHVHISDNQGRRDDHQPLGRGTIPLQRIVRALKDIGYDETVTLEIFTENDGDLTASRERVQTLFRQLP